MATPTFETTEDARARCNRLPDPSIWLDANVLDAQCELGRRHHPKPDSGQWIDSLDNRASRTSMRELVVHSLLYRAVVGEAGAAKAARIFSAAIDSRALGQLLAS